MKPLDVARTALVLVVVAAGARVAKAQAGEPGAAATVSTQSTGTQPNLADLRRMIYRGHAAEALKQLDVLAGQNPAVAGVDTLRGTALYMQHRFVEADAAFASALKQNPRDEEATQMRGLTLF